MRVINRLALPGKIKSVRLNREEVIVHTDDEVIVYKRAKEGGQYEKEVSNFVVVDACEYASVGRLRNRSA